MKKISFCGYCCFVFFVFVLASGCKEEAPGMKDYLLGNWKIQLGHIYSIYSFKASGNWTLTEKVSDDFNKIIENRGKALGKWELEEEEGTDITWLSMTANSIERIQSWQVDVPVRYQVLQLDEEKLVLQTQSGRKIRWEKVTGKEGDDKEFSGTLIKMAPIEVNLAHRREHAKYRFLCMNLDFYVTDPTASDYIAMEQKPESEEWIYSLHPKIRDIVILFFSDLPYKEVKTLPRVKEKVVRLQENLNPYFGGGLTEIHVAKVVVTTNEKTVKDFQIGEIEPVQEAPPEEEK